MSIREPVPTPLAIAGWLDQSVPLSQFVAAMSVFAYSSARLEIIRGVPDERRRFLDRGIASLDPAYIDAYKRYARVLRQRNALLQSGSASGLEAWDEEFSLTGGAIQKARATYAENLASSFASIVAAHGYHIANLRIEYRPSVVEDLRAVRRAELRAHVSLSGPQRDDVAFTIDGRNASDVASAGEQKMLVLFMKFAKLELFRRAFDEPALFLLDDLDAELDHEILQNLLTKMPPATQVFVTSAKERFVAALEAASHRRLVIENGGVTAFQDFI